MHLHFLSSIHFTIICIALFTKHIIQSRFTENTRVHITVYSDLLSEETEWVMCFKNHS